MDTLKPIGYGPAPVRDTAPPVTPLRDTTEMPGAFNFDVGSPAGLIKSSQANVASADDFMTGLGSFLFGENNGSLLGGTPIGAIARGAAQIPGVELAGDVVASVAGAGIATAYDVVHHIPLGWLPGGSDATFAQLPKTPEWIAVNEASNDDLLGGGNQKFEYTKKFLEDAQQGIRTSNNGVPFNVDTLSSGLLAGPGGSAGQLLGQMFEMFQLPQRYAERGLAGTAKVLSGMNRVQESLARAAAGETDLSEVELAVVRNVGDGSWTEERALDFMASHGSGLSHDEMLQLVGTFATDPTVVVSLGSGGLARLGKIGVNVAENALSAGTALTRAQRAGVAVSGFQSGEFGKIAKYARNFMDPLNTFSSISPGAGATIDLMASNVATKAFHNAHGSGANAALAIASRMGISEEVYAAAASRGTSVALDLLSARRQRSALVQNLGDELVASTPKDVAEDMLRHAPSNIEQMVREHVQRTWKYLWDGPAGAPPKRVRRVSLDTLDAEPGMHELDPELVSNYRQRLELGEAPPAIQVDIRGRILGGHHRFEAARQAGATDILVEFPEAARVGNRAALAKQLSDSFGGDEVAWIDEVNGATDDTLAYLHNVLYAQDEKAFRKALDAGASEYSGTTSYDRLNMVNDSTLHDLGARAIIDQLLTATLSQEAIDAGLTSVTEVQVALLKDFQARFADMGKYIIDPANPEKAIKYAIDDLNKRLADGTLPAMITREQLAELPVGLQEAMARMPHRILAFRPEDGKLWNIEQNADGLYEPRGNPWNEHVMEGIEYRPGHETITNLVGQALPDVVGKPIDWIISGGNLLTKRISGAAIRENALQRAVKFGVKKYGLEEKQVRDVFDAMTEHMNVAKKMTVRSLSAEDMWEVAVKVLPRNSNMDRRALLAMVVDGFEGDLRYVGMPIKFTGRMKKVIAKATGYKSNFAGEVSEDLYNRIRFRYNPLFHTQEFIEPWVLNSQRGISTVNRGVDADIAAEAIRRNLVESGLMRQGDTDAVELGAQMATGDAVAVALADTTSRMAQLGTADVKGLKRFAQLRGIMAGKGRVVRGAFKENGLEEEFLAFKRAYAEDLGRVVDDNETALRWLSEQQKSNLDIGIDFAARPGQRLMNFEAHMLEAEQHTPMNMGELKTLALNAMARSIGTIRGHDVSSISKMRHEIAVGNTTVDEVVSTLRQLGAGKAYVGRVQRALNFHWVDFWKTAKEQFNMSDKEVLNMQHFIMRSANAQDMKPAEFLSQIVEGSIAEGKGVVMANELEHIGRALSVLRSDGTATAKDFASQIGEVFWQHMHPSGRESFFNAIVRTQPDQANRFARMANPPPAAAPSGAVLIRGTKAGVAADGTAIAEQSPADHFASLHRRPVNGFIPRNVSPAPAPTRAAQNAFEKIEFSAVKAYTGKKVPTYGPQSDMEVIEGTVGDKLGGDRSIAYISRDDDGRVAGVLILGLDQRGVPTVVHSVSVREDVRRTGVATFLYDAAQADGYDVLSVTGKGGVTEEGRLFSEGYQSKMQEVLDPVHDFQLMGNVTLVDGTTVERPMAAVSSEDVVGPGIRAMPWKDQERVLNYIQNVLEDFPYAEIHLYDIYDIRGNSGLNMRALAYVWSPETGPTSESIMILDETVFGANARRRNAFWAKEASSSAWFGSLTDAERAALDPKVYGDVTSSKAGTPFVVSSDPQGVVFHEMAHGISYRLMNAYGGRMNPHGYQIARDWMRAYMQSSVRTDVSVYSSAGKNAFEEAFAEILDLSINPANAARAALPENAATVASFKKMLEETGEYVPRTTAPAVQPVSTATWSPEMTERLLARASSGVVDPDPNFERAYRFFAKWSQKTLGEGTLGPQSGTLGDVLRGMPTDDAVPYDRTHALIYDTVYDRLKQLENDTYRMQYFARDRTLLERSINHPFFGIYPASYMWFKILPEMVRFIAKEPFGLQTGALAYTLADVEKAVAIQREYDPSFDEMVETVGHSSIIWMLGYLLPATPWDIPASAPTWMRDLSQQGLDSAARAESGLPAKDMNYWSSVSRVQDYVSPMRSADQLNRVAKELGGAISGSKPEQEAGGGERTFPFVGPFPNEQASPVQQLTAPLADAMDELTKALSQIGAQPAG
jgi:hypothetical protein